MTYHVYVLRNPENRFYIGFTADLARRLFEHQNGLAGWTRSRGPWDLVYQEAFDDRAQAIRRERALKSGQGRASLRERLSGRAGPPQAD